MRKKWNAKNDGNILYQLLLTIYKDKMTQISEILNEFIAVIPLQTQLIAFRDCNWAQIINILIHYIFKELPSTDSPLHNEIIDFFVHNKINGNTLINDISKFVNKDQNDRFSTVLVTVLKMLQTYKYYNVAQCRICAYTNSSVPQKHVFL